MGYNGSVDTQCWKLHACFNCSTVFRYLMKRKVTATGSTEEVCRQNLNAACVKAMEEGVDFHPCPECGMVQPEMVRARRLSSFTLWTWVAALAVCALAIALACEVAITTVMGWALVLGTLSAVMMFLSSVNNPNKDAAANQRKGQAEVEQQILFVDGTLENPPPRQADVARVTDGRNVAAFALLGAGLFCLALPELARVGRGWPLNDHFFPAVVGPGDQVTYYFHRGLSSIKGYWKGKVTAEMAGRSVTATTNDNSWGSSISVKSSEKSSSVDLWTSLSVPSEARPRSEARLNLKVEYVAPVMSGSNTFREEEGSVDESPLLKLADAGAGGTYNKLAWLGLWVGGGMLVLAGCKLGWQAKALQGNGHKALVAEE